MLDTTRLTGTKIIRKQLYYTLKINFIFVIKDVAIEVCALSFSLCISGPQNTKRLLPYKLTKIT